MLAKEKDEIVKKRLLGNREVPSCIKNKLIQELSINTFKNI